MFAKLFICVICIALLGMILLGIRQKKLETVHTMVRLHQTMDEARHQTWDLQVRISERIEPAALVQSLRRSPLNVEPVTATPKPAAIIKPTPENPHHAD